MSSSGMLRPNEVIFYHPLDDFDEHTLSQTWTGSAGFTPGKIGDGASAATANAFSIYDEYLSGGGTTFPKTAVGLDENHALLMGRTGSYVVTVSGDTGLTYNTVGDGAGFDNVPCQSIKMWWSGTSGIVAMTARYYGDVEVLRISDVDTISKERKYITDPAPSRGGGIARLSDTKFFVSTSTIAGGALGVVCEIGPSTFTIGDDQDFPDGVGCHPDSACGLDETHVLVFYEKGEDSGSGYVRVGEISGTGVTYGDEVFVTSDYSLIDWVDWNHADLVAVNSSTAVILWPTLDGKGAARVASVSGTTVTLGDVAYFEPDDEFSDKMNHLNAAHAGGDRIFVSYQHRPNIGSTYKGWVRVGDVDGSGISFGAKAQTDATTSEDVCVLSDTKCVLGFIESEEQGAKVGILDQSATIQGDNSYPVASGSDRVVAAMWVQNLSENSSTISVGRDYDISMDDSSIALGPNPATWSGSAIESLMATMNDDANHLLVMDFEHTGAGNWTLNTSIDGSGWVSHSTQDSGTRDISPSSVAPSLTIEDGTADQWVDELALWAGDKSTFEQFTETELYNLYNLADRFDKTMDRYDEGPYFSYGSGALVLPEVLGFKTAECDLVIFGPMPSTDSTDLFLKTIEQSSGVCDLFVQGVASVQLYGKQFDWLYRYHDHHPQIIGSFEGASSATIQIWEVTNGQNTPIELTSSGCYAIGDTGRWGWSTQYLPRPQGYARHYYYLMTSDNNYAFDGQFIFDIPEEARWIHPSNREDYLV